MTFEPGQLVGERFEVVTRLGGNRHGSTSKAKTVSGEREVAIKKLHREADEGTETQLHKAQQAQRLSRMCDELMTIDQVEVHEQDVCCIMSFLSDRSLRRHRAPERNPKPNPNGKEEDLVVYFAEDFEWLARVAKALDFLSENETIHGDVKPTNILFGKNSDNVSTAYLSDIEIPYERAKKPGGAMQDVYPGTAAYLAREVFLDRDNLSARSDQYALAVTLYQWLSGELPYSGNGGIEMYKAFQKGCRPISELCPLLPAESAEAIHRALSGEPEQRFDSSGEFVAEFTQLLPTRKKTWFQFPAVPAVALATTVVAAFLAFIAFRYLLGSQDDVPDPTVATQVEPANQSTVPPVAPNPKAIQPNTQQANNLYLNPQNPIRPQPLMPRPPKAGNAPAGNGQVYVAPAIPGAVDGASPTCLVRAPEAEAAPKTRIETKPFEDQHRKPNLRNESAEVLFQDAMKLLQGNNPQQNIWHAEALLRKAAEQDMPEAHFQLARIYENPPVGFKPNRAQALRRYQKAAELGLADAQFQMGEHFESQLETRGSNQKEEELFKQAYEWYEKAAIQDRPDLSRKLSEFCKRYHRPVLAEQWYQTAMAQLKSQQQAKSAPEVGKPSQQKYDPLKDEKQKSKLPKDYYPPLRRAPR